MNKPKITNKWNNVKDITGFHKNVVEDLNNLVECMQYVYKRLDKHGSSLKHLKDLKKIENKRKIENALLKAESELHPYMKDAKAVKILFSTFSYLRAVIREEDKLHEPLKFNEK